MIKKILRPVILVTVLSGISVSCGDLNRKVDEKMEKLLDNAESLDSLINKEVDKVMKLDSLIDTGSEKAKRLDSLINKSSSRIDSLLRDKIQPFKQ